MNAGQTMARRLGFDFHLGSFSLFFLSILISSSAAASEKTPECWANDETRPLSVMNDEVLEWKESTPNQYKDRAYVEGRVVRLLRIRNSHVHFEIQIGQEADDTIEVIYNRDFGDLPRIRNGMVVDVCGDYITSRKRAGSYPASPAGAIIHWVHYNPGDRDGGRHEDGFLVIDGVLYGQDAPQRSSRRRKLPALWEQIPAFAF